MIDIEKMKALAAHLHAHEERHHLTQNTTDHRAAADAIDSLLSELEARSTCALCRSTGPDVSCAYPTEINRQQAKQIQALRTELEAANQKRKEAVMDAERAREERNREHVKLNAEWIERTAALRAELEAREAALRQISAIEDKMYGGDWDEIEEARRIASAALAQRQEGEEK